MNSSRTNYSGQWLDKHSQFSIEGNYNALLGAMPQGKRLIYMRQTRGTHNMNHFAMTSGGGMYSCQSEEFCRLKMRQFPHCTMVGNICCIGVQLS